MAIYKLTLIPVGPLPAVDTTGAMNHGWSEGGHSLQGPLYASVGDTIQFDFNGGTTFINNSITVSVTSGTNPGGLFNKTSKTPMHELRTGWATVSTKLKKGTKNAECKFTVSIDSAAGYGIYSDPDPEMIVESDPGEVIEPVPGQRPSPG